MRSDKQKLMSWSFFLLPGANQIEDLTRKMKPLPLLLAGGAALCGAFHVPAVPVWRHRNAHRCTRSVHMQCSSGQGFMAGKDMDMNESSLSMHWSCNGVALMLGAHKFR